VCMQFDVISYFYCSYKITSLFAEPVVKREAGGKDDGMVETIDPGGV
jgi:hypothetical protein